MNALRLVARPLLASVFIVDGLDAIRNADDHATKFRPHEKKLRTVAEKVPGFPTDAKTLSRVTGAITVGAGVLLATGKAPRLAAGVLAALAVPLTVVRYPFWTAKGPHRRELQAGFMRNAALVGGLLIAAEDRVGKPSLGWKFSNWREHREDLAEVKADRRASDVRALKAGAKALGSDVRASTAELRAKIAH